MQVTTTQTALALAALRSGRGRTARRRRRRTHPVHRVTPTTLDRALREIARQPRVRVSRVAAARQRLHAGPPPDAAAVAEMLVRRSICDRLR